MEWSGLGAGPYSKLCIVFRLWWLSPALLSLISLWIAMILHGHSLPQLVSVPCGLWLILWGSWTGSQGSGRLVRQQAGHSSMLWLILGMVICYGYIHPKDTRIQQPILWMLMACHLFCLCVSFLYTFWSGCHMWLPAKFRAVGSEASCRFSFQTFSPSIFLTPMWRTCLLC